MPRSLSFRAFGAAAFLILAVSYGPVKSLLTHVVTHPLKKTIEYALPLAVPTVEAQVVVPPPQPMTSSPQSRSSSPRPTAPRSLRAERIVIPASHTDAAVVDVGVTAEGNLDVPHNFVQAGWYRYGPVPGEPGNAVIDGHVDNGALIPGIFKRLKEAKMGDEITVRMSDGSDRIFTVTDSSVYTVEDFPSETVFHGSGEAVLKIITCHGTFIPAKDTYDQRLVVTAVLTS